MTHEQAERIATALLPYSDTFAAWSYEYPGYIDLALNGGGMWAIGTANGTYGADLYINAEVGFQDAPDRSIDTGIPADSTLEPAVIAKALFRLMADMPREADR